MAKYETERFEDTGMRSKSGKHFRRMWRILRNGRLIGTATSLKSAKAAIDRESRKDVDLAERRLEEKATSIIKQLEPLLK